MGNPGQQYEGTRHNVGFRIVDKLAEKFGGTYKGTKSRAVMAEVRTDDLKLLIAKPTTYMNESGQAVAPLMRYFKIEPERMIVVHDDADLKHGQLRLKFGGGSGGHHGIESIEQTLRTKDFYRVRVGVGRPVPGQLVPAEFLLAPMSKGEAEELSITEQDAADAVLSIINDGIERAMNRFNKRG